MLPLPAIAASAVSEHRHGPCSRRGLNVASAAVEPELSTQTGQRDFSVLGRLVFTPKPLGCVCQTSVSVCKVVGVRNPSPFAAACPPGWLARGGKTESLKSPYWASHVVLVTATVQGKAERRSQALVRRKGLSQLAHSQRSSR